MKMFWICISVFCKKIVLLLFWYGKQSVNCILLFLLFKFSFIHFLFIYVYNSLIFFCLCCIIHVIFCVFLFLFSSVSSPHRYYRANSVRYPTPQCEGVCALNHYCAITRVDYHEFRHCLESAASALASNSARPNVCIPIIANIALLLTTYTIMKCQQRQLFFEWLQFFVIDLIIGILLFHLKMCKSLIDCLSQTHFDANNSSSSNSNSNNVSDLRLQLKLSSPLLQMTHQKTDDQSSSNCISTIFKVFNVLFHEFIRYRVNGLFEMCHVIAKQFHSINLQVRQCPQIIYRNNSTIYNSTNSISTIHVQQQQQQQLFDSNFSCNNRKSSQITLYTKVVSFTQISDKYSD